MGIYFINPQYKVDSLNILNIMTLLINDISNYIKSIYNIVIQSKYNLIIDIINDVLGNYLKIYNFFNYGLKSIYIESYSILMVTPAKFSVVKLI